MFIKKGKKFNMQYISGILIEIKKFFTPLDMQFTVRLCVDKTSKALVWFPHYLLPLSLPPSLPPLPPPQCDSSTGSGVISTSIIAEVSTS